MGCLWHLQRCAAWSQACLCRWGWGPFPGPPGAWHRGAINAGPAPIDLVMLTQASEHGLVQLVPDASGAPVAQAPPTSHAAAVPEGLGKVFREARQVPAINLKRVYRIMRTHGLLLALKPMPPRPQRRHEGREAVNPSNLRWCSDGFEFRCDNGESVRATFALDCCDREAMSWAATTAAQTGDLAPVVPDTVPSLR